MISKTTSLLYWILYTICALLALLAGALVSFFTAAYLAGYRNVIFFLIFSVALAILLIGSRIEERILWKGRFNRTAEMPHWATIYRKNVLLDKVPPPFSLGFALGLLSQLLV
jgi:hypothetical protein